MSDAVKAPSRRENAESAALFVGALLLNLPAYFGMWRYSSIVLKPENAGWSFLSAFEVPAALPCWIFALCLAFVQTLLYIERIQKGSRETVYPVLATWLLSAPYVFPLMKLVAPFYA